MPRAWGVRRYGFHGTSHAYVSREAGRVLGRDDANVIVLHLGNGASAAAVSGGRSIDTSMGLTPLEGLVMGTRSGDVDPALVLHLRRTRNLSTDEIDAVLNSRSGLLALAGDNDMREVQRRAAAGDPAAELALDVYCYRIRKYVGAYLAALGGADAIVFTAGVGENDARVRARSLAGLERLGIVVDPVRNEAGETVISPDGAPVAVLVIPTDEELEMATQAATLLLVSAPRCNGASSAGRRPRRWRLTARPSLTLLHNPHCPTSVHALDALEAAGRDVTVRKYLLVAERLSEDELRSLAQRLQGDPPDALIRRDKKYKDLGLDADGLGIEEVVAILVEHPSLLQRPILDDGTAAMIGRPRSRAADWAATGRVADVEAPSV